MAQVLCAKRIWAIQPFWGQVVELALFGVRFALQRYAIGSSIGVSRRSSAVW